MNDAACNPPVLVCELGACVPGCDETGGLTCAAPEVCDAVTGHCGPVPPCMNDRACNVPDEVCEAGACVTSCTQPTGPRCARPQVCDQTTGRCRTPRCLDDGDCLAPVTVCDNRICVDGCAQPGGLQCTGRDVCDPMTGRCETPPCMADGECGPPAMVCESQLCVDGCTAPGGIQCTGTDVCNAMTGRCDPTTSGCSADADCEPPYTVCDTPDCNPGCAEDGGRLCGANMVCHRGTGRCISAGTICFDDGDCAAPMEVCDLSAGACSAGCTTAGCPAGSCDAVTGRCTAGLTCRRDSYEPNDSQPVAANFSFNGHRDAQACTGDDDFYRMVLGQGTVFAAQATFASAEGNVELSFIGPTGQTLVSSTSQSDDERIQYRIPVAGLYLLRVSLAADGGEALGNDYLLRGQVAAPCVDDSYEEDDRRYRAPLVTAGVYAGRSICPLDDDYFAVEVGAGQTLTADVLFAQAQGDIDLWVEDPLGRVLDAGVSTSSNEQVVYTSATAQTLALRVMLISDQGATAGNTYELSISVQ